MSRSRPVEGPTISLFPFLAVLLCMMGALLVLLVLFSRSARRGDGPEAAEAGRQVEEMELAREHLAWRLDQLAEVRRRTADDLARARLQLAGVEEHSRTLADELERLEQLARSLADDSARSRSDDVAALERKLKSSRESLDSARAEMASRPAAYAVVPYVGVNGTHRRPLYIECCVDGVFLQPEGIRLGPSDFEGPPGPGNPLASALRAAREHLARTTPSSGDPAAQPYPLLLVRPSGVMAYYAAREAISSWGTEFGYQLIDEDWTLTFPPRDLLLAEVEKRAVEESRRRLAWLAEVRPAKPTRPTRQYRAATTRGGVVADGGPSVLGDQSRWNWTEEQAAGGRPGVGGGDGEQSAGGSPAGGGAGGFGSGSGAGRPLAAGGGEETADHGDGQGDAILGGGGGNRAGLPGGRYGGGSRFAAAGGGSAGAASGPGADNGLGAVGGPNGGGPSGRPDGDARAGGSFSPRGPRGVSPTAGDDGAGDASGSAASGAVAGGGAAGNATGGNSPGGSAAGGSAAGGAQSAGAAGGGPAMPGLLQAGSGGAASGGSSSASATAAMAQSRGKNWASLATQDRPIPLTRPIRLECAAHEFRLLDDGGRRVVTRIPLDGDTAEAIDPLVRAVHDRVGGWGLAGERMYWKPELLLSETPDGRSRREDLERLLADSGLDTRRVGGGDEIRSLPPVERPTAMLHRP